MLLWIGFAIAWGGCGIAASAHSFSYSQGEFWRIAKETRKADRILSTLLGLFGPVGLFATIVASGFEFKHGWSLQGPHGG